LASRKKEAKKERRPVASLPGARGSKFALFQHRKRKTQLAKLGSFQCHATKSKQTGKELVDKKKGQFT